jgi:hypothetical protein
MTTKIARSSFLTFLDVTPSTTPTYRLLGDGITDASINYNPTTSTEQYITEDSARTALDSYAPTMPVDATAKLGDPIFAFVDTLRKARAVLDAPTSTIVNVWKYEDAIDLYDLEYPAEQQSVIIAINTFGGAANVPNRISFSINYNGNPVAGSFNILTKTFTPS